LSRIKTLNGPRVRGINLEGEEKVYRGKDLPKSQVLSSEQNTERVTEDENNNSEDGEDDELPCVVDKSEVIRPYRHTVYYQHMNNTFSMHIKQAAHTAFSIKKVTVYFLMYTIYSA